MSAASPLTASNEIAVASVDRKPPIVPTPQNNQAFGTFTSDIINISTEGRKQQQSDTLVNELPKTSSGSDSIRVSSSVGENKQTGGLTEQEAVRLYKEIAKLL